MSYFVSQSKDSPSPLKIVEKYRSYWDKPKISRGKALWILQNEPAGTFLVRRANEDGHQGTFLFFSERQYHKARSVEILYNESEGFYLKGCSRFFHDMLSLLAHHCFHIRCDCCLIVKLILRAFHNVNNLNVDRNNNVNLVKKVNNELVTIENDDVTPTVNYNLGNKSFTANQIDCCNGVTTNTTKSKTPLATQHYNQNQCVPSNTTSVKPASNRSSTFHPPTTSHRDASFPMESSSAEVILKDVNNNHCALFQTSQSFKGYDIKTCNNNNNGNDKKSTCFGFKNYLVSESCDDASQYDSLLPYCNDKRQARGVDNDYDNIFNCNTTSSFEGNVEAVRLSGVGVNQSRGDAGKPLISSTEALKSVTVLNVSQLPSNKPLPPEDSTTSSVSSTSLKEVSNNSISEPSPIYAQPCQDNDVELEKYKAKLINMRTSSFYRGNKPVYLTISTDYNIPFDVSPTHKFKPPLSNSRSLPQRFFSFEGFPVSPSPLCLDDHQDTKAQVPVPATFACGVANDVVRDERPSESTTTTSVAFKLDSAAFTTCSDNKKMITNKSKSNKTNNKNDENILFIESTSAQRNILESSTNNVQNTCYTTTTTSSITTTTANTITTSNTINLNNKNSNTTAENYKNRNNITNISNNDFKNDNKTDGGIIKDNISSPSNQGKAASVKAVIGSSRGVHVDTNNKKPSNNNNYSNSFYNRHSEDPWHAFYVSSRKQATIEDEASGLAEEPLYSQVDRTRHKHHIPPPSIPSSTAAAAVDDTYSSISKLKEDWLELSTQEHLSATAERKEPLSSSEDIVIGNPHLKLSVVVSDASFINAGDYTIGRMNGRERKSVAEVDTHTSPPCIPPRLQPPPLLPRTAPHMYPLKSSCDRSTLPSSKPLFFTPIQHSSNINYYNYIIKTPPDTPGYKDASGWDVWMNEHAPPGLRHLGKNNYVSFKLRTPYNHSYHAPFNYAENNNNNNTNDKDVNNNIKDVANEDNHFKAHLDALSHHKNNKDTNNNFLTSQHSSDAGKPVSCALIDSGFHEAIQLSSFNYQTLTKRLSESESVGGRLVREFVRATLNSPQQGACLMAVHIRQFMDGVSNLVRNEEAWNQQSVERRKRDCTIEEVLINLIVQPLHPQLSSLYLLKRKPEYSLLASLSSSRDAADLLGMKESGMESVLEGCMDRGVVQGWVETGPMVKLIEVAQCCAMIESELLKSSLLDKETVFLGVVVCYSSLLLRCGEGTIVESEMLGTLVNRVLCSTIECVYALHVLCASLRVVFECLRGGFGNFGGGACSRSSSRSSGSSSSGGGDSFKLGRKESSYSLFGVLSVGETSGRGGWYSRRDRTVTGGLSGSVEKLRQSTGCVRVCYCGLGDPAATHDLYLPINRKTTAKDLRCMLLHALKLPSTSCYNIYHSLSPEKCLEDGSNISSLLGRPSKLVHRMSFPSSPFSLKTSILATLKRKLKASKSLNVKKTSVSCISSLPLSSTQRRQPDHDKNFMVFSKA